LAVGTDNVTDNKMCNEWNVNLFYTMRWILYTF